MDSINEYSSDTRFAMWANAIEFNLEQRKFQTPSNSTCLIPGTDFWSPDFKGYPSDANLPGAETFVPQLEQQLRDAVNNPLTTQITDNLTYNQLTAHEKLDYFKRVLREIMRLTPDASLVVDKPMIRRIYDAFESKMPRFLMITSIECAVSGIGFMV